MSISRLTFDPVLTKVLEIKYAYGSNLTRIASINSSMRLFMRKFSIFLTAGILFTVFIAYVLIQREHNSKLHPGDIIPNQQQVTSQSNIDNRISDQKRADEQKAILAKVAQNQAIFAKQQEEAAKGPGPLVSFSDAGNLTTDAIHRLKLTEDQVGKVEAALTDLKKSCQEDFVSRTKLTDTVENDNGTTYFYYTRASEDRGMSYENNFRQSINTILSEDNAASLWSGFNNNNDVIKAQMGFCDMEFQINRGIDGQYSTISYKYINPNNGSTFREGSSDLATFKRSFGGVFDLQN